MKTERGIHGWRRLGPLMAGMLGAALLALPAAAGATLPGENGRIVFDRDEGTDPARGIYAVNPDGSQEKYMLLYGPGSFERAPAVSPDGAHFAFVDPGSGADTDIRLFTFSAGSSAPVTSSTGYPERSPAFLPSGERILYVSERLAYGGEIFSSALDGSSPINLTGLNPGDDLTPDPSPDGSKIAYSHDGQIWIMNADGSGRHQVTTAGGVEPSFSPDGTRIAFRNDPGGNADIYVMNADGSGVTRLTSSGAFDQNPSFSPDGSKIAYASGLDGNGGDIYVMNADGSGKTAILSGSEHVDDDPHWVPLAASYGTTWDGVPGDTDGDGVPDSVDALPLDPSNRDDADGDGVPDSEDAFPHDPTEHADADGDGIGDNADTDDDNDGIPDHADAFPNDPGRSMALTVKAKPRQAFDRLVVRVGCGAVACTVKGSGKAGVKVKSRGKGKRRAKGKRAARHVELRKRGNKKGKAKAFKLKAKPKRAQIAAGKTKRIRLVAKGKDRRKLGRLLKRGKGTARIKLRASTPAGAKVGAKVKVKLKQAKKKRSKGKRGRRR